MLGRNLEGIEKMEGLRNVVLKGINIDRPNVWMTFEELQKYVNYAIVETCASYNFNRKIIEILLNSDDVWVKKLLKEDKIRIDKKGMQTFKAVCMSALRHYQDQLDNLGLYNNIKGYFNDYCDSVIDYIVNNR